MAVQIASNVAGNPSSTTGYTTYDIEDRETTNGTELNIDLSCLNFLNNGSECLETLENMKTEMESIRDNTSTFYFESDNGTEPGSNYNDACQKIINYIEEFITFVETSYSSLTKGIADINNELVGCFSWEGLSCKENYHNDAGQ